MAIGLTVLLYYYLTAATVRPWDREVSMWGEYVDGLFGRRLIWGLNLWLSPERTYSHTHAPSISQLGWLCRFAASSFHYCGIIRDEKWKGSVSSNITTNQPRGLFLDASIFSNLGIQARHPYIHVCDIDLLGRFEPIYSLQYWSIQTLQTSQTIKVTSCLLLLLAMILGHQTKHDECSIDQPMGSMQNSGQLGRHRSTEMAAFIIRETFWGLLRLMNLR